MRHLRAGLLLIALAASGIEAVREAASAAGRGAIVHVTPDGAGARDGTSWASAATLDAVPSLVRPGVQIWLRADLGAYRLAHAVELAAGGTEGRPAIIRGVDADGAPRRALIVGTRGEPYDPRAEPGGEAFRLARGADHLRFEDLDFRNQGHCFHLSGDLTDLAIARVDARNVRRFLDNYRAEAEPSATVSGLVIRDVRIQGFSKDAIRLQYDTHDVLIEDVVGDSERQDGDNFAEGVSLDGTAHDVVLRRVTMRNAHDTANAYWNGDGFATEAGNYRIRFEDTLASGNTDAGYDLKSSDTVLVRASASDNKQNFKLWGRNVRLENCVGLGPFQRGGTGHQDQVQVLAGAEVAVAGCHFADSDAATTVFRVQEGAALVVSRTTIVSHARVTLSTVGPGGALTIQP